MVDYEDITNYFIINYFFSILKQLFKKTLIIQLEQSDYRIRITRYMDNEIIKKQIM